MLALDLRVIMATGSDTVEEYIETGYGNYQTLQAGRSS
jgi:hypothetical protein